MQMQSGHTGLCVFGSSCRNSKCTRKHDGSTLPVCEIGGKCREYFTDAEHRNSQRHPLSEMICMHPDDCVVLECRNVHNRRLPKCSNSHSCYNFAHGFMEAGFDGARIRCPRLHSARNCRVCKYGNKCRNINCQYVHQPMCGDGYGCIWRHKFKMCNNVTTCKDSSCSKWHASDDLDDLVCCYYHARPF